LAPKKASFSTKKAKAFIACKMPKENTTKLILTESDVSKLIETRLLRFKHMVPSDFMNTYLVAKSNDSIYQTLSLLRIEELKDILRFIKQEKGIYVKLTGKKQELIERCSKYLYGDYRASSIASISSSPSSTKRYAFIYIYNNRYNTYSDSIVDTKNCI
jgi:hypothetical protein